MNNTLTLSPYSPYPDVPVGAVVGYEDHITLQTLPNEGGQVFKKLFNACINNSTCTCICMLM